ncbi:MAG: SapC family protein [Rhodanobacter sp.]
MAEVLFYERPVPLNRNAHKDLRLKPLESLKFAISAHSVPLTGAEFAVAARDMMIVFGGKTIAEAGPLAVLGLRENENLYVDAEGRWERDAYIPAFVRRYPFVLAEKPAGAEGDDFTVFLDEAYSGFNTSEGERLFKEDGSNSEMLTKAVGFLGEFQDQVARTKWFMEQLVKHDLLEPRSLRLEKGGKTINLNGLFMVNEDKLRALDAATTQELLVSGAMGWIYAHLLSLVNIDRVAQRLSVREQGEAANTTTN